MSSFKRSQQKHVKKAYRVRNWPAYEEGLRARGSLTVWLSLTDQGKLANWDAAVRKKKKRGRESKYSNHAIETSITLGKVLNLKLRRTGGFLRSLFGLLKFDNEVPDHSTVSRRTAKLGRVPLESAESSKPVHILIDSSGLRVHVGQMRNAPKNRDYRKLHIAVDEQTGDVVACDLTSKSARDASRVPALLRRIDRPLGSVKADAAYDKSNVYEAIEGHHSERTPRVLIPPRKGAKIALATATTRERNRNIRSRARLGNRTWHKSSGFSKRSKVETTFSRYKTILGPAMRARRLASQRVEASIGCRILNVMSALGMPDGYMVG